MGKRIQFGSLLVMEKEARLLNFIIAPFSLPLSLDLQVEKKIGQGQFSVVYRAKNLVDGQIVALKKIQVGVSVVRCRWACQEWGWYRWAWYRWACQVL